MPDDTPVPEPWCIDVCTDSRAGPTYYVSHLWQDEQGVHTDEIAELIMDYPAERVLANARLLASGQRLLKALTRLSAATLAMENSAVHKHDRPGVEAEWKAALGFAADVIGAITTGAGLGAHEIEIPFEG